MRHGSLPALSRCSLGCLENARSIHPQEHLIITLDSPAEAQAINWALRRPSKPREQVTVHGKVDGIVPALSRRVTLQAIPDVVQLRRQHPGLPLLLLYPRSKVEIRPFR